MAGSDLTITISGDRRGLKRDLAGADRDLSKFSDSTKTRMKGIAKAAAGAGLAFGTAGLAFGIKKAIDEWRDAEKVGKQTEAVLKSTQGVAKVTANEVGRLAEKLSLVAGVDDEVIQRGANLLLTFKGIRNEAGKNNDIFNQTVRTTLDMASAMAAANDSEINLKTASIQVGKALNDPIKGMSALSRVGVTFSESQTKVIERLVASGNKMGAQKMILRELKSEFGGSARANADSMDRLGVAIDNVFEKFGKKLAPIITEAATKLVRFVTQMKSGKGAGGDFARVLGRIGDVIHELFVSFRHLVQWVGNAIHNMDRFGDRTRRIIFAVGRAFADVFNDIKRLTGNVIAFMLHRFADFLNVASKIPIIGDRFEGLEKDVRAAANRVDQLGENIRRVPKRISVAVQLKALQSGDFKPLQDPADLFGPSGGAKITEGLKSYSRKRGRRWLRDHPAFGRLGLTGPLGKMPTGADVDQFNDDASRFGLIVTSGFRAGDDGWHGQDRARDYATPGAFGPSPGQMAFARYMAANFGSKLLELIYTPLGFGIKNGQRVAPYAQADHYDHVHVAMRRGGMIPGQGTGDKVPVLAEPGEGFINRRAVAAMGGKRVIDAINAMIPRFVSGGVVARAAYQAGFRGPNLLRAVAEAKGESGWDEGAVGDGGASIGLMQIHQPSHPWARGLNLKDPLVNMRAAFRVFKSSGWGAWHADHTPHIGAAQAAIAGLGSKISKGLTGKAEDTGPWFKSGGRVGKKTDLPEGITWFEDGSAVKVKNGKIVERREATREGRKLARERTPVKGRTTLPSIGETREDLRYERQQEGLEGIRDDDQVTRRERRRAERSYMQRAKVLNARARAKRKRLRQINRELKGKLRPATRQRLLQEKAQLVSDIGQIHSDLRQITYSYRDQVAPFEAEVVEPPTPMDFASRDLALAQLTPGTADDLAALTAQHAIAGSALQAAFATPDPRDDIEAANNLKSLRDAISSLTGEIEEQNRLQAERDAIQKQIAENQKTIIATAKSQGPALERALLMIVNGGLGGNAGLGRSFPSFAGLGGLART